jgi:hypothetical protein
MKVTNVPDANKYLAREYRKGWEPNTIWDKKLICY